MGCQCVQLCACVWLGVSSTHRQCVGLGELAWNRSGLCWGRDDPAGAHGTAQAQSSTSFPADETGAAPVRPLPLQ